MIEQQPQLEAPKTWPSKIIYPNPRGFCAGIVKSINMYDGDIEEYKAAKAADPSIGKLLSLGQPAHNPHVIKRYEGEMESIDDMSEAQPGDWVTQGPHGTSKDDLRLAEKIGVRLSKTECNLVSRVISRIISNTERGIPTIYFGEEGHAEAIAVTSFGDTILVENQEAAIQAARQLKTENSDRPIAFASQTTKNADEFVQIGNAIKEEFPDLEMPKEVDICYATRDRQLGVKDMLKLGIQALIVVGSPTSSNSMRLFEIGNEQIPAYLIRDKHDLDLSKFIGIDLVGAIPSASAPEEVFQEVVELFTSRGSSEDVIQTAGAKDESKIHFQNNQPLDFRR